MTGLPALLAALGGVGVLFALLSFMVVLFSGAGLSSDLGWIGGNLVVGVLLLVASAVLNFDALRERMSSGEAKRAGKYGTSAVLSTVLFAAISYAIANAGFKLITRLPQEAFALIGARGGLFSEDPHGGSGLFTRLPGTGTAAGVRTRGVRGGGTMTKGGA